MKEFPPIQGFLILNKPQGMTSFQVVALVRRLSGVRRVGHGGTLDPMASGVLPVALGRATRVLEFLRFYPKIYLARGELGVVSDTYDAWGRETSRADPSGVTRERLEGVLPSFVGSLEQRPPAFSALRHRGRRFYELARAGQPVPERRRRVDIHRLELREWAPPYFTLEVACGQGTYIRSLIHDLGQALGCGARLAELERRGSGGFLLEESISVAELREAFAQGWWAELLYPLDEPLLTYPAAILGEGSEARLGQGQTLSLASPGEWCRAYSGDGRFLALLRYEPESGLWHPEKVFLHHTA